MSKKKKQDLEQVEYIARKYRMSEEERREFGDYLEECKRSGEKGTLNEKGDYTLSELDRQAREFLGLE